MRIINIVCLEAKGPNSKQIWLVVEPFHLSTDHSSRGLISGKVHTIWRVNIVSGLTAGSSIKCRPSVPEHCNHKPKWMAILIIYHRVMTILKNHLSLITIIALIETHYRMSIIKISNVNIKISNVNIKISNVNNQNIEHQ